MKQRGVDVVNQPSRDVPDLGVPLRDHAQESLVGDGEVTGFRLGQQRRQDQLEAGGVWTDLPLACSLMEVGEGTQPGSVRWAILQSNREIRQGQHPAQGCDQPLLGDGQGGPEAAVGVLIFQQPGERLRVGEGVFVIRIADPGGEGRVVGGRRHIAALEGGKQAGDRPGEGELFRPGRRVQQLGFVDSPKFRLRPPLTPFARLSRRYCRLLAETVSMRAGLKKRPSRDAGL